MESKYAGMTADQMRRAVQAEQDAFEATTWSDGFLVADLRKAFELVQDRENWKNPVNFLVGNSVLDKMGLTVDMIEEAIVYFQGCVPKINHNVNFVHIKSSGYVC